MMMVMAVMMNSNGPTTEITRLESGAAWCRVVEEWFMEEQGAFFEIFLVVEVLASPLVETIRGTPHFASDLHVVRCVRAALAGV